LPISNCQLPIAIPKKTNLTPRGQIGIRQSQIENAPDL